MKGYVKLVGDSNFDMRIEIPNEEILKLIIEIKKGLKQYYKEELDKAIDEYLGEVG